MNQAQKIIDRFRTPQRSGFAVLSEAIGYERSALYRWTYPKDRGGTGGLVPAPAIPLIQDAARRLRIPLPSSAWNPELKSSSPESRSGKGGPGSGTGEPTLQLQP